MIGALILAAAISCAAPGGTLTLRGEVHMPLYHTPGSVFAVVDNNPGYWRKVAWDCGDEPFWCLPFRVVAVLKDGKRVPCDELMAMEADDLSPRWINGHMLVPETLHRLPMNGHVCVMLFVRFPGLRSDPVAIEVSQGR